MQKVDELSYIGVGAKDLDAWSAYAQEVLGLEVAADSDSHNLYLRMDERHHRFIVHPAGSEPEDVSFVGWQVRDAAAMDVIAGQLDAAGVPSSRARPRRLRCAGCWGSCTSPIRTRGCGWRCPTARS